MRNVRKYAPVLGRPVTAQRRRLLSLIQNSTGHIDARELHRRANRGATSVSLATVYRNLRLFCELGLIEERQLGRSRRLYEAKPARQHLHFVCYECGAVIEFTTPLVEQIARQIQEARGCRVTRAEIYLEGHCPRCEPPESQKG